MNAGGHRHGQQLLQGHDSVVALVLVHHVDDPVDEIPTTIAVRLVGQCTADDLSDVPGENVRRARLIDRVEPSGAVRQSTQPAFETPRVQEFV